MVQKENKPSDIDCDFIAFLIVSFLIGLFFLFHSEVFAKEVCPIFLDDKTVARVAITIRGTVLSFPVKPSKVILGKSGSFGIEYVENDLAISPLGSAARSNLFVYLQGRRFTFDLVTDLNSGCTVVPVRDALEVKTSVEFKEK